MTNEEKNREKVNSLYDSETKKYVWFMCQKDCKFYNNGCAKGRVVRDCAKKSLKNRE